MPIDRFLIAPFDAESGQQTDVKPWLITDSAFEKLENAYVFRGRVRKRPGSRWLNDDKYGTRFRIAIGTTDVAGNFAGTVPVNTITLLPIAAPTIGQMFSVSSESFTVNVLGLPANLLRSDQIVATASFNTTTGAVVINGATPLTIVYYYPALPVMGLISYERSTVNDEPLIGFDTRFAYQYLNGWERLNLETTPNASYWLGSDSQFFWGVTWTGTNAADKVLFVTNFNENEYVAVNHPFNLRYMLPGLFWTNFRPAISATEFLNAARLVVVFKNRLLYFNTWEGVVGDFVGINYSNRVRYSQIGSPLDALAFRQDIPGRGNAIDAPTTEQIITVEFVKDRLIVFFERSTWELVYQGNQAYPFAWQQINTELGAESTFSIVPFDKVAIGVGNVGIVSCNAGNVERIDFKIPNTVFDIHNDNQGVQRVYGIRDYFTELIYWAFPSTDTTTNYPFPNRILVYNYKNGTWSFNNDSITAFGYFQPVNAVNWSSTSISWSDPVSWNSGELSGKFRDIIAGNQQGWTFIVDSSVPVNAAALQITDIAVAINSVTITAINHNLRVGDFVLLQDIIGTGTLFALNDKIYRVDIANDATPNEFSFSVSVFIAGIYEGAGTIARVSNINIMTKEFNFYASQGRNAYISKIDFMVNKTSVGEINVDLFVATSSDSLIDGGNQTGALIGTSTLDCFAYPLIPYEATAKRVVHPVYFQGDGEFVQFKITMTDQQMMAVTGFGPNITGPALVDFQLHWMSINATPTTYRFQ